MADPQQEPTDFNALPPGTRARVITVILSALAIALVLVWLLTGGGTQIIRPKFALATYLGDSTGLAPGSDVRLNGVEVGKVHHVEITTSLNPSRVVKVVMSVQDRYREDIPVDSVAALTSDTLIGDRYVNIAAGKAGQKVGDGSEIASLVQSTSFNPADLVASLQASIQSADAILTEIDQGKTPTALFIKGHAFYDQLHLQIGTMQKLVATYADRNTSTGKLFYTDDFYNQIRQPILNVDRALDQIQRGETPAGQFVTRPAMYDQTASQIHQLHQSLADIHAGKGSAGEFLETDDDYRKLQAQVKSLNDAVDALTKGDGAFAQMLASSQLYDSLNGQSASMRDFLKDFREHPQKYLRIKLF